MAPAVTCIHADYAAKATDGAVLQRPLKSELMPTEIKDVFGYPRNLKERYSLGAVLGAGSFGVVREVTEKRTKRKYAVKTIPKSPKNAKSTPRYLLKLQTEVDAMGQIGASLDSVFLKDVFEDDLHVHLVMELCEGGSILDRLKDGEYSERQVADIMRSVLRFLAQCHAKGLIYRDVKPDNFMFLHNGPDSAVKATDFGLSIRHRPEDPPLKSRSGTPAYMAPEVIQQSYNEACDAWSAGIMMYQLLTGRFPFWDNVKDCTLQQVWKAILTDRIDFGAAELKPISEPAKQLLRGLLERDPRKRMKPSQALTHSWIQDPDTASDLPLRSSVVQRLQRFATYGHLKQLVLRMIADEIGAAPTSQQEAQELMTALAGLFDELDVDNSGSVSVDELMGGLERLGYDISEAEMEQLMQRVDINHDGSLELAEFVAGLVDWNQLQADKQWGYWVQLAFQKLDCNGDGFISLDEIIMQLPMEGSTDSERLLEARRMLREADSNGDGRVSREEFAELLTGTSLPDTLNQYDPRLKHFGMDEEVHSIDWTPLAAATAAAAVAADGSVAERTESLAPSAPGTPTARDAPAAA